MDTADRIFVCAQDTNKLWTKALFYGQELRLLAFEAMLIGAIDLGLRNMAASACVAWIVSFALGWARLELGRANVARRTSVDERFLT